MKVTLHMAVSMDGYIAGADGNSSWVSAKDESLFRRRCREAGAMAVGRRTYEQYLDEIYPVDGADNIVLTNSILQSPRKGVHFVHSPKEALERARALGHGGLLVSGGGKTSAGFLDSGLITEIYLSVHPVILGDGLRVFDGSKGNADFFLLDVQELDDGLAQLHYEKTR